MMADDLRELLAIEEEDCQRTLQLIGDLRLRIGSDVPDVHEIAAFGAYLHSLYGGIESTLKNISRYLNIPIPEGEKWHVRLIDCFTSQLPGMSEPLISHSLQQQLDQYRGFRHVFRIHYAMQLEWEKMRPLIESAQPTMTNFYRRVQDIVIGNR